MDVRVIGNGPAEAGNPSSIRMDRLVQLLGTPVFQDGLFQEARRISGCAHLSALVSTGTKQIELVLAANQGSLPIARTIGEKYVGRYWKQDPVNAILDGLGSCDALIRVAPRDIPSSRYRSECYGAHGLVDRFTILRNRHGVSLRLNLYRSSENGPFPGRSIDAIVGAADLLFSLVAKHHALTPGTDALESALRQRLLAVAPHLSDREFEVCWGIACGRTSEAIAIGMGIRPNTVLTYRKRAYARLSISSQNELMRLLIQ